MTHENWNVTLAIVLGAVLLGLVGMCAGDDMRRNDAARAECIKQGRTWISVADTCVAK